MQGLPVDIGKNRHRRDPHFPARTNNADCDLSPVGDKDFLKHFVRFLFFSHGSSNAWGIKEEYFRVF